MNKSTRRDGVELVAKYDDHYGDDDDGNNDDDEDNGGRIRSQSFYGTRMSLNLPSKF